MRKILFKCLLIIILLISVFILPKFYPVGKAIYFRLFLLLLILIESFRIFKIVFVDNRKSKIISDCGTVLFSFFVIFIFLEMIFMFIPRSNPSFNTLATHLWYDKYFKRNSMGFRDKEPPPGKPAGQQVILFVGDSFTAGSGLNSVDYRFSDIVEKELNKNGKKYIAINIGKEGATSREEYDTIIYFYYMTKIKPDKIVLQYLGDDIRDVAAEEPLKTTADKPLKIAIDEIMKDKIDVSNPFGTNRLLLSVIRGSYLFDYIYWTYHQNTFVPHLVKLIQGLKHAYKNDYTSAKHKKDLMKFVVYAKENSIQLIVVVFPFMNGVEISDSFYVNDITGFFQANNVSVVNVSPLVKDIPVSKRIVSGQDAHPSKKVNKIVADEILKKLQ